MSTDLSTPSTSVNEASATGLLLTQLDVKHQLATARIEGNLLPATSLTNSSVETLDISKILGRE